MAERGPKSVSEFLKEFEALHPESRFLFRRDFRQFHDTVLQFHGLYPFILETIEREGELIHARFHTDTQLPFEVELAQVADAIKNNWLNDHIEYLKELDSMVLVPADGKREHSGMEWHRSDAVRTS